VSEPVGVSLVVGKPVRSPECLATLGSSRGAEARSFIASPSRERVPRRLILKEEQFRPRMGWATSASAGRHGDRCQIETTSAPKSNIAGSWKPSPRSTSPCEERNGQIKMLLQP
jgi:hypothetical protein